MSSCILFHFYIKPQQYVTIRLYIFCCILFHFYIKPQQYVTIRLYIFCCILFHFYIKPQQRLRRSPQVRSCILFHFYIKPQRADGNNDQIAVVSYSISTSNHNNWGFYLICHKLYLIPFLHQTTTRIKISQNDLRCILFHFYIKPQQVAKSTRSSEVVSYSISTSNHNVCEFIQPKQPLYLIPFLHQTTTRHSQH